MSFGPKFKYRGTTGIPKGFGSSFGHRTAQANPFETYGGRSSWTGKLIKSRATQGAIRFGSTLGLYGMVGAIGGTMVAKGILDFRSSVMKNLMPNSVYPAAEGRWGMSAGPANNAGLQGMRFDFRRR